MRTVFATMCGCLFFAAAALGQTIAPPSPPAASPAARGMEELDQRLAGLHRSLGVTATQEPQWEAFAIAVRQNAKNMADLLAQKLGRPGSMSALDQLRFLSDAARLRADDLQRLVPPFETLYSTMSADQRTEADRVIRQIVARGKPHEGEQ